jgi:predicted secreted hydrolase
MSRLASRGEVAIGGERFAVRGDAWMDREWSTSALGDDQAGWDWFALQFDDGTELMFYQLRHKDGSPDRHSAGTYVDIDGNATHIRNEDVELVVLDEWRSPRGGVYPAGWTLRVESLGLDVEVRPRMADQELDTFPRYWEGAVAVSGSREGRRLGGHGYVELTGYADRPLPQ